METPIIRAKAKDSADGLDNLVAYMEEPRRSDVIDYVFTTLDDVGVMLKHAVDNGIDPLEAQKVFITKMREYFTAVA